MLEKSFGRSSKRSVPRRRSARAWVDRGGEGLPTPGRHRVQRPANGVAAERGDRGGELQPALGGLRRWVLDIRPRHRHRRHPAYRRRRVRLGLRSRALLSADQAAERVSRGRHLRDGCSGLACEQPANALGDGGIPALFSATVAARRGGASHRERGQVPHLGSSPRMAGAPRGSTSGRGTAMRGAADRASRRKPARLISICRRSPKAPQSHREGAEAISRRRPEEKLRPALHRRQELP